jgi:hypothetical protein
MLKRLICLAMGHDWLAYGKTKNGRVKQYCVRCDNARITK